MGGGRKICKSEDAFSIQPNWSKRYNTDIVLCYSGRKLNGV